MTSTSSDLLNLDKRKRIQENELDTSLLNDPSKADLFLNEYLDDAFSTNKKPRLDDIESISQVEDSVQEEYNQEPNVQEEQEQVQDVQEVEQVQDAEQDGLDQQNQETEEGKDPRGSLITNYQCKVVNNHELMQPPPAHLEKHLGHVVYTGAHPTLPNSTDFEFLQLYLLPRFTSADYFATIQIRIPAEYLLFQSNLAIKARAVWGTHVYTDDSDIVAILIHSGLYIPIDLPESEEWALNHSPAVDPTLPDHDLHVTCRVLPRLLRYQGSLNHHISSRSWGSLHDGESITVLNVEKVERGSVLKQGRKMGSKAWIQSIQSNKEEEEQIILLENDGKGWFVYSKKGIESTFQDKLSLGQVLVLESARMRFQLEFQKNSYLLKPLKEGNQKSKSCEKIEWNEKGLVFGNESIHTTRFMWKPINL